jgi:hypothetical protein
MISEADIVLGRNVKVFKFVVGYVWDAIILLFLEVEYEKWSGAKRGMIAPYIHFSV